MSARAVKLAYKTYAPKVPTAAAAGNIYISHGLLGNAQNWATPASKLAEAPELQGKLNKVYALDMRNHGGSPHTVAHTNAGLASDLEAVVLTKQQELHRQLSAAVGDKQTDWDSVKGKGSILMGHSMGGFAIMGSLLRRYNETTLLPIDPFEATDGFNKQFGTTWEPYRRRETSAAMRSVNEDFDFAATQPIRDILVDDLALMAEDKAITSSIGSRVPKVGRITAAIIVDITPTERLGHKTGEDSVKLTLDRMVAVHLDRIKNYADAAKELTRVGMLDKGMRDFVMTNLSIDSTGAKPTTWRCNLKVLYEQYGAFQPFIVNWFANAAQDAKEKAFAVPKPCTLPTLFVFGEDSPYNNKANRREISHFFPNSTQVEVKDAGHFVHYQNAKGFLEAVVPFIAQHL